MLSLILGMVPPHINREWPRHKGFRLFSWAVARLSPSEDTPVTVRTANPWKFLFVWKGYVTWLEKNLSQFHVSLPAFTDFWKWINNLEFSRQWLLGSSPNLSSFWNVFCKAAGLGLCRSISECSLRLGISLGFPEASKQLTEQAATTSHGVNIRNAILIAKVVEITLLKKMFLLQITKFGFFFS